MYFFPDQAWYPEGLGSRDTEPPRRPQHRQVESERQGRQGEGSRQLAVLGPQLSGLGRGCCSPAHPSPTPCFLCTAHTQSGNSLGSITSASAGGGGSFGRSWGQEMLPAYHPTAPSPPPCVWTVPLEKWWFGKGCEVMLPGGVTPGDRGSESSDLAGFQGFKSKHPNCPSPHHPGERERDKRQGRSQPSPLLWGELALRHC